MVYSDIPEEWKQSLGYTEKNSKRQLQNAANDIDSHIINREEPRKIVTYEDVVQKNRTLNPGPLIKQQVNKNRGFKVDKTTTPSQMIIKNAERMIDMTSIPSFSIGNQYNRSYDREFNYVNPKNNILNAHMDKEQPKIINPLNVTTRVQPKKVLMKTNVYDTDREITNYTPIHKIDQPIIRVYNTP